MWQSQEHNLHSLCWNTIKPYINSVTNARVLVCTVTINCCQVEETTFQIWVKYFILFFAAELSDHQYEPSCILLQLLCSSFRNTLQNISALGQPDSCRQKGDCMPLSKTFLCVKSVLSLLCVINCDSEKVNSLLFNKHNFVSKTMHHLFTFNQPIWEQLWDPRKYERQFRARVINTTSSTPFRDFSFFFFPSFYL